MKRYLRILKAQKPLLLGGFWPHNENGRCLILAGWKLITHENENETTSEDKKARDFSRASC